MRRPLFQKSILPIFHFEANFQKNYASYRYSNGGILKNVKWGYENISPFLKSVELSGSHGTLKFLCENFKNHHKNFGKPQKKSVLNCEQTTVDTDHPKAASESQKHVVEFKKKVCSNRPISDVMGAKTLR